MQRHSFLRRLWDEYSEVALRIVTAIFFLIFAYKVYLGYQRQPNLTILLLLVSELLTVWLVLTARFSKNVDRSLYASTITIASSLYFLLIRPSRGIVLVPGLAPPSLMLFAIALQLVSKLYLGRSFGLRPANRGIVTKGPYRLVRHPLYLAYFLNHVGFLVQTFSYYNLIVLVYLYVLYALRIREEERLLKRDERYQEYARAVRYRVIPMCF